MLFDASAVTSGTDAHRQPLPMPTYIFQEGSKKQINKRITSVWTWSWGTEPAQTKTCKKFLHRLGSFINYVSMEMHLSEIRLNPHQTVTDRLQHFTECKSVRKASSVPQRCESKLDSFHQRIASMIPSQSLKIPESCEIFNPPQESHELC